MGKIFIILEKAVAIILMIFGLSLLYLFKDILEIEIYEEEIVKARYNNFNINNIYALLLIICFICSGALLIFKKRIGWILSIAILVVSICNLLFVSFFTKNGKYSINNDLLESPIIFFAIFCFLFGLIVLMFNKYFRLNYNFNVNLATIGVLVILFLLLIRSIILFQDIAEYEMLYNF